MKQAKNTILLLALVILLFLGTFFSADATYSYWSNDITGKKINASTKATIGHWRSNDDMTFPPALPPPEGATIIPSPQGNLQFSPNDIVYHKGELILIKGNGISEQNLLAETPTYNTRYLGWRWYPNRLYHENSVVTYNDKIYLATGGTGNLVGAGNHPESAQFWKPVGEIRWIPGKSYRQKAKGSEPIVEYMGELYKAKWHINGSQTPPPLVDAFEKVENPIFQAGTSYSVGSVVRYQGSVFRAVRKTSSPPETVLDHWERLNSAQWSPYQRYQLHDVVTHQGNIYQVVNGQLANQGAPQTIPYAWNQINTYYYNPMNLYSVNNVVVEDGVMYRSLANSNKSPLSDLSAWVAYGTPASAKATQALGFSLGTSRLEEIA